MRARPSFSAISVVYSLAATAVLFVAFAVAGCAKLGGDACTGVRCGPCPQPVEVRVHLADPALGEVSATGVAGVTCSAGGDGSFYCSSGSVGPGTYALTLSAAGHDPETLTFTLAPPGAGCCACGGSVSREVTLARASRADGGASDAGGGDAGVGSDAGACAPSAIAFPSGGSLNLGQLCDDVFACVDGEVGAMAVMAASARFTCSATPESGCPGWTCAYRSPSGPSTLDAAEIAEICTVTMLAPQPAMTCMIYL